ncbi:hypothetical protein CDL12_15962 [Handroanthus impetiginosus]|uniref:LysM domain-containing protein n=1 Tax=Handroanthus impetiginosus TaxID=429701 RepID=A0A2G9H1P1_9LAMI|nr:hypothetical protein CDL12_15962 [Handroanthus impetiginosus]
MELKLTQSSLPTTIFNSTSNFPEHFTLLAKVKRWKLHIQRISWKGQEMSKEVFVHVVKEDETLNSISKLYEAPILEIAAANKGIVDVDLVFGGQLLNIPSAIAGNAQVCLFNATKLHEDRQPKTTPISGFRNRQWNQIFTVPSSHRLSLAKTTGSFLVLVPLVAFCIRCIIGAFQNRVTRKLRRQPANKSSKSMRWRTLNDLRDPDAPDAELGPDYDPLLEEQEELHFEDVSQSHYTKLKDDYQKFLSECGMSQWGYWRGGSPQ